MICKLHRKCTGTRVKVNTKRSCHGACAQKITTGRNVRRGPKFTPDLSRTQCMFNIIHECPSFQISLALQSTRDYGLSRKLFSKFIDQVFGFGVKHVSNTHSRFNK